MIKKFARILLSFFLLAVVPTVVANAKDCDSKGNCECKCKCVSATARGNGPCSIKEDAKNKSCNISYWAQTGSLGPDSFGPPFDTKANFLKGKFQLPDHRTPEYEKIVRRDLYRVNSLEMLKSGKLDRTFALLLLIRSAYISDPEIDQNQLKVFDALLDKSLSSSWENIGQLFFLGQSTEEKEFVNIRIKKAWLKFSSGDVEIFVRWRELLG